MRSGSGQESEPTLSVSTGATAFEQASKGSESIYQHNQDSIPSTPQTDDAAEIARLVEQAVRDFGIATTTLENSGKSYQGFGSAQDPDTSPPITFDLKMESGAPHLRSDPDFEADPRSAIVRMNMNALQQAIRREIEAEHDGIKSDEVDRLSHWINEGFSKHGIKSLKRTYGRPWSKVEIDAKASQLVARVRSEFAEEIAPVCDRANVKWADEQPFWSYVYRLLKGLMMYG